MGSGLCTSGRLYPQSQDNNNHNDGKHHEGRRDSNGHNNGKNGSWSVHHLEMNRLTITQAADDDREFAYQAKKAAFGEYVQQVWGWNEDEQRALHERRFAPQEFRVIFLDGTRVGILAVVMSTDCLKLNQLFILPEYQSKGIGAECVRRIITEGYDAGKPVRLQVLKVNDRAQAFYERLGFVVTGQTQTHVQMERNL